MIYNFKFLPIPVPEKSKLSIHLQAGDTLFSFGAAQSKTSASNPWVIKK